MDNVHRLDIERAKGLVELKGAAGILYSLRVDGVTVRPHRGRWHLPATQGEDVVVRAHGLVPGFHRLSADGVVVADMGAEVPRWLRWVTATPVVLVVVNPLVGAIVAVFLVLLAIATVKNVQMPLALRAVLPVVNTVAAALIIAVLVHATHAAIATP